MIAKNGRGSRGPPERRLQHTHITLDQFPPDQQIIHLEDCTSNDWRGIGRTLASLPQLQSLTILNCNTDYGLFQNCVTVDRYCNGTSVSLYNIQLNAASADREFWAIMKLTQLDELYIYGGVNGADK